MIFLNTFFSFSSTYLFSTVVEAVTTGIFFSCVRISTFSVSPLMETEVSIPGVCFWSIPVNTIPVPGIYDKVPVSVDRSAGTCIVSMVCFSINSDLTNFCLLLQPATATSSARQKKSVFHIMLFSVLYIFYFRKMSFFWIKIIVLKVFLPISLIFEHKEDPLLGQSLYTLRTSHKNRWGHSLQNFDLFILH